MSTTTTATITSSNYIPSNTTTAIHSSINIPYRNSNLKNPELEIKKSKSNRINQLQKNSSTHSLPFNLEAERDESSYITTFDLKRKTRNSKQRRNSFVFEKLLRRTNSTPTRINLTTESTDTSSPRKNNKMINQMSDDERKVPDWYVRKSSPRSMKHRRSMDVQYDLKNFKFGDTNKPNPTQTNLEDKVESDESMSFLKSNEQNGDVIQNHDVCHQSEMTHEKNTFSTASVSSVDSEVPDSEMDVLIEEDEESCNTDICDSPIISEEKSDIPLQEVVSREKPVFAPIQTNHLLSTKFTDKSVVVSPFSTNICSSSELSKRIQYIEEPSPTLLVNLEGMKIVTNEDVENIHKMLEYKLEGKQKVNCLANYDEVFISEEVIGYYSESVEYFSKNHYSNVVRFTTRNMYDSMKKFESVLQEKNILGRDIYKPNDILANKYIILKELGQGSFGTVKLGQDIHTGHLRAIKVISKKEIRCMDLEDIVAREIEIMNRIGYHEHIVQFIEMIETKEAINIIMEYIEKGSLDNELDEHETYDEETVRSYAHDIFVALDYLHSKLNVFHRDIQLANICIDSNGRAKIIDFGTAELFDPTIAKHSGFCGHNKYASPEMLKGEQYFGNEVDIWSVGVCLFKLLTGFFPFRNTTNILTGKISIPLEEEEDLSDECKDFLQKILVVDVSKRLSMNEILQHKWINTSKM